MIRVGLIGNLILNKDMDGRELRKWIFGTIALWAEEAPTTKVGSVLGIFLKWYNPHEIYHFNHFKVYKLVALSTFTLLCNPYHYLVLKHSHHPERGPYTHKTVIPPIFLSPTPDPDNH